MNTLKTQKFNRAYLQIRKKKDERVFFEWRFYF